MARKGFTLLELMLVVVIVGIIVAFAIPGFLGVRRRAEGRQASTQLRLIHTAENIEYLENDLFVACSFPSPPSPDPNNCNTALDLDLPDDGWTYAVTLVSGFTATAAKGDCTYTMNKDDKEPDGTGGCVYDPW